MLDTIDQQIIKLLQINGKATIKEIANKLNLTTSPIFERIKRLEKEEIIKGYTALVDPKKVDKGQIVFCNISMPNYNDKNIKEFENKVDFMPEVLECYHIAGVVDYQMKVLVKDIDAYDKFLQKISLLSMVRVHSSVVVLREIKHTTIVPK
ncbi:MAG: Lrp/AsnC family transcriptional regulator [Flavobacteriaceae bacterium]|jgi:DNA-binding Lrp family transcriptional regulator|nr:Lrp/AsnC family transcriptional regulator [Flavobacteriaceae bacterium]CAI8266187.1 MAG: DNA-binding transcriptional activator DecR [Flavobacteriaceae bacterium]